MPSISLIVLAFNDARSLESLLPRLSGVLDGLGHPYEIIVVDDGSSDDTAQVAMSIGAGVDKLRVVRHARNRGVGAAFTTGVTAARHDLVGYIDGDGQYDPADLQGLLAALSLDKDVGAVSGVRVERADRWLRTLISAIYRWCLRSLYGLNLRDVNSGIKLYRRGFLGAPSSWTSQGPFFDAEVLIRGIAAGYRVAEVPIRHMPRRHGSAGGATLTSIHAALTEMTSSAMATKRRRTIWALVVCGMLRAVSAITRPLIAPPRAADESPSRSR